MNQPLVSVIIPCFNAEQFLSEAIESILAQTYPRIEIIVIDDGSTDGSLEIIKSYGDRLIWRTGANKGGNYARNLGFTLSQGDYIQYLDADDYLLPEKIAKQVRCLQGSADVVYSDWQHLVHQADGSSFLDAIRICGPKTDFLESLLANERWSNLTPILFSREIVIQSGGWDESLTAAQDRDFLISVALTKAKFVYQPGCDSIYRIPNRPTVSSACRLCWFQAHCLVMEKAEQKLLALNQLNSRYKKALARAYRAIGREYLYYYYDQSELDKYRTYAAILEKIIALNPQFFGEIDNLLYKICLWLFGYKTAEKIAYLVNQRRITPTKKIELLITAN
ncbi:MAG: glycosyltransferase [Cyanobacteria bacterium J06642_3]